MRELVVASYMEDLSWVEKITGFDLISIYKAEDGRIEESGGDDSERRATRIPNAGREAGQYLWHIIKKHGSLADLTVFVQGDFHRHNRIEDLSAAGTGARMMAYLGVAEIHDRKWPFPLSSIQRKIHDSPWDGNPPPPGTFSVGAQFWIRKQAIERFPVDIYKKYYDLRLDPHFAHILEPTWHAVFGIYKP